MASMTYIEFLLQLLKLILHRGKRLFSALLKEAMKNVTGGTLFQEKNDQGLPAIIKSSIYDISDKNFHSKEQKTSLSAELVRSFCNDAIRDVPFTLSSLLPTVSAMSEKIENSSMQRFLVTLLSLNCAGHKKLIVNSSTWTELPLIPTDDELAGNLVENDKDLTPVRMRPYDNPEQYMETYFRLIRAETFSAMQKGIKNLKSAKLDPRDMNVYYNIHLVGFHLQGCRFSLAINFTPGKRVERWEASSQMMYGNLVCISINRKFDEVIWATVSDRDAQLLNKKQIITLELLDENVKSVGEIIKSLQIQGGMIAHTSETSLTIWEYYANIFVYIAMKTINF